MKPWEQALERFLADWRHRPDVVGALVCGSHVTGGASARSDIDVHIILAPGTTWRERGNRMVDGFLVEYFANPPAQIRAYFAEDVADRAPMAPTQFHTGRIVFDQAGDVDALKRAASRAIRRRYPALRGAARELARYSLWDARDNLRDLFERGTPAFAHAYHHALHTIFDTYARELRQPRMSAWKIYDLLTSARVRRKYAHPAFPDRRFARLMVAALAERHPAAMLAACEQLVEHVMHAMGGELEIDGWTLRSAAVAS